MFHQSPFICWQGIMVLKEPDDNNDDKYSISYFFSDSGDPERYSCHSITGTLAGKRVVAKRWLSSPIGPEEIAREGRKLLEEVVSNKAAKIAE